MTISFFGWTVRVERVGAEQAAAQSKNPVEDKAAGVAEKKDAAQAVADMAVRPSGISMGVYL